MCPHVRVGRVRTSETQNLRRNIATLWPACISGHCRARVLRRTGFLYVVEQNPWNALTQRCPSSDWTARRGGHRAGRAWFNSIFWARLSGSTRASHPAQVLRLEALYTWDAARAGLENAQRSASLTDLELSDCIGDGKACHGESEKLTQTCSWRYIRSDLLGLGDTKGRTIPTYWLVENNRAIWTPQELRCPKLSRRWVLGARPNTIHLGVCKTSPRSAPKLTAGETTRSVCLPPGREASALVEPSHALRSAYMAENGPARDSSHRRKTPGVD